MRVVRGGTVGSPISRRWWGATSGPALEISDSKVGKSRFGSKPRQDLNEGVPTTVTYTVKVDNMFDFKPGDIVRLTGKGWKKYSIQHHMDEVIGRDEVGPKIKAVHDDGQHYRIVNNGQFGDFSAELVEVAPLAPARLANGGRDYYGGDTVLKFIEGTGLGFSLGNAVKYIARAGKKSSETACEDLEKAVDYIQREIARLKGEG